MGDNLDSDLLYDDFQENDRKDFENVNILCALSSFLARFQPFGWGGTYHHRSMGVPSSFSFITRHRFP